MSAVPAWKRLGLKLKGASSDGSPVSAPSQPTQSSAPAAARFAHQQDSSLNRGGQYGTPGFNKRKQFPSSSYSASDSKRPRWDESNLTPSRKSVSFSQDTKKAAPKKPKKKKAPKQQPPKEPFDFTPVLEYLRTWQRARENWKFNKNHQTLLVKHIYNGDAIPASDIDTFYLYIRDIKGASRKRLVEQAEEIKKKDMEAGSKGFPEGTKAPEQKQQQYEEMLADLLKNKAEIKEGGGPANGNGKRSFDEAEFVLRTVDKDIQQRVVKRMRAETIIDELASSDSGESPETSKSTSTAALPSRVRIPAVNGDAEAGNGKDGQKLKAKRRKKLRTADSSSESESSDSSDSSDSDSEAPAAAGEDHSSSSSSESDSDEETNNVDGRGQAKSSSSSSSSSDSGSDSESAESAAGAAVTQGDDDSGSDGDSESSDSDDDDA